MRNVIALVLYFPMIWLMVAMFMQAVVKQDEARDQQRKHRYEQQQRTKATIAYKLAD